MERVTMMLRERIGELFWLLISSDFSQLEMSESTFSRASFFHASPHPSTLIAKVSNRIPQRTGLVHIHRGRQSAR